jgi:glycosyltransferase involved in cell wall biosynthesis
MMFSIIMPSFLGHYPNAARNREQKFIRALESVLEQSCQDWELIVVSDGCKKTTELITPYVYEYLPKIRLIEIEKQKTFSGAVRNAGIYKASGDVICYLDTDDILGTDHLSIISDNIGNDDWVLFNDWIWNTKTKQWYENHVTIEAGRCGTSNIAHRTWMGAYWSSNNYLHDWIMIRTLQAMSAKYTHICTGEYYVAHVPNNYDV